MSKGEELRGQILDLVATYSEHNIEVKNNFIPGITHVPVSGKLIDRNEIINCVDASLDGWFTTGRFARDFEKSFAKYMSHRNCSLTNSGSSANLLALSSLTSPVLGEKRLKKGDEVITVAAGFPTTVNPIIQNGLVPVFVDVELDDYGINIEQMKKAYSPKVKAIMLAHTLGNPFNLDEVTNFANDKNLWFIEDCADAVGSKYRGKMVGTFGDIATVSFYPAHHITMGEGGAVLTQSSKLKKIIESFRDWGRDCWCEPGKDNTCGKRFDWQLGQLPCGFDHKYIYNHIGYNLKLTDMQAAIGIAQLKKIDGFIESRKENFNYYISKLRNYSDFISMPKKLENADTSWFGFPMRVRKTSPVSRNKIIEYLNEMNIGTRLLFGGNLTKQPLYENFDYRISGSLKNTDCVMENVFWIGVQPNLTNDMRDFVIDCFKKVFE